MDRIFLDANVLFSAAYREDSGLLRLWKLESVDRLTSVYAADEARRNLNDSAARVRLEGLLERVVLVFESADPLPRGVRLVQKDEPILRSASAAGATHLLTGDLRDFGRLFGRRVGRVLVLTPGEFLRTRS